MATTNIHKAKRILREAHDLASPYVPTEFRDDLGLTLWCGPICAYWLIHAPKVIKVTTHTAKDFGMGDTVDFSLAMNEHTAGAIAHIAIAYQDYIKKCEFMSKVLTTEVERLISFCR